MANSTYAMKASGKEGQTQQSFRGLLVLKTYMRTTQTLHKRGAGQ